MHRSLEAPAKWPAATLTVLALTATLTALQFVHPLLAALERAPGTLGRGELWRLITPLFVHADGWRQIVFNFCAIAFLGTVVERIFGWRWWLVFYFVSGVLANAFGALWQPWGAGASVAGCGLLGALAAWLWAKNARPPRFGAAVILLGAVFLSSLRDIHGPPLLIGAALAAIPLSRKN